MPLSKHVIMGIHITDRASHVDPVQHLLTEYGCIIRTRVGLHDTDEKFCSPNGLLLVELIGEEKPHEELMSKLNDVEGVEAKRMVFDHP